MTSKVQRSRVQDGQLTRAADRIDTGSATGRAHVGASDQGARRQSYIRVDVPDSVTWRVMHEFAEIPFGETRTDGDLEGAS